MSPIVRCNVSVWGWFNAENAARCAAGNTVLFAAGNNMLFVAETLHGSGDVSCLLLLPLRSLLVAKEECKSKKLIIYFVVTSSDATISSEDAMMSSKDNLGCYLGRIQGQPWAQPRPAQSQRAARGSQGARQGCETFPPGHGRRNLKFTACV